MATRLLLIEESSRPLEGLSALELASDALRFEHAEWGTFLPETLLRSAVDLVMPVAVTDTMRAIALFRWLKSHPIQSPTLAILPAEPEKELLSTAAQVVDDFVFWPVREGEWRQRIERLVGSRQRDETAGERLFGEMGLARLVGRDPAFLRVISNVPLFARSGSPVLITGETGTGKELCARAIHHLSRRRSFPFIPVDCGAFPDHLFENEFFGHTRGAFTDAHDDQGGLVAMAEGGTLFLDEIDALSLIAQAKLLRFLQEHAYKPLGADRFRRADVNVLAASNQDLEEAVATKRFRSDLFFRLNVLRLHLIPLRERLSDIELLARHFVDAACGECGLPRKLLTPGALRRLELHDWPGNIRELGNVIQRAVVLSEGTQVLSTHISIRPTPEPTVAEATPISFRQARTAALATFEKTYVEQLFRKCQGNVTRAAREARKDRRAFGRLVKKYGVRGIAT